MEDQAPSAPAEGWTLHAELAAKIEPMFAGIVNTGCRARSYVMATWVTRMWGHPAIILSPDGPQWHAMDRCKLAVHHPEIVETEDKARTSIRKLVECGFLEVDPASIQEATKRPNGTVRRPPKMYRFTQVVADWLKGHAEKLLLCRSKSPESTSFSCSNSSRRKKEVDSGDLGRDASRGQVNRRYGDRSLDAVIRAKALARSKNLYHPSAPRPHETPASTLARLRGSAMHRVYAARDLALKKLDAMTSPKVIPEPLPVVLYTGGPILIGALETIPDRPGDDECFERLASKVLRRCLR